MKKNYAMICTIVYFGILLLVLYMNPPIIEYMPVLNTLSDFDKGYMTDCVESDTGGYLEVLNNSCYDKISINIGENGDGDAYEFTGQMDFLNNIKNDTSSSRVDYTTPYMCPRDKIRAVCKKGL